MGLELLVFAAFCLCCRQGKDPNPQFLVRLLALDPINCRAEVLGCYLILATDSTDTTCGLPQPHPAGNDRYAQMLLYPPVSIEDASKPLKASVEFQGACPASATLTPFAPVP